MLKQNVRLGDILVNKGLINDNQLIHALSIQKALEFNKKLGEVLIDEGYITYKRIIEELCEQLHLDFVDLYGEAIDFELIGRYPLHVLKHAPAIPYKKDNKYIYVATSNPLNYPYLEIIERTISTKPIKLLLTMDDVIENIFERITIMQNTKSITAKIKHELSQEGRVLNGEESSIMQLIRLIMQEAIIHNASDVHIEPDASKVSIRCRIDGILREIFIFELQIYNALASRIKILGNLDISERRKAQDGRFSMKINDREYDFRLSTSPTMFGESIVVRILDQEKILLNLRQLGLEENSLVQLNNLINSPYGIVLITGPTGSGKTTTLYAALNEIKSLENKIMTIEDPVEYQLPLVQQTQVNEKIGYSFLDALKSFLRQDPDTIMIGEIRDLKTLNAAVQASTTGHLVFSTMHTNDAASAITRMIQMGLEPFLIADSLLGIVAQRLVRKNCPHCKFEYKPHHSLLKKVEQWLPDSPLFFKSKGCQECDMSGYSGRIMITEILSINDHLSDLISKNAGKYEIINAAQEKGMFQPMILDGLQKALNGIIPLEEVMRVAKSG